MSLVTPRSVFAAENRWARRLNSVPAGGGFARRGRSGWSTRTGGSLRNCLGARIYNDARDLRASGCWSRQNGVGTARRSWTTGS